MVELLGPPREPFDRLLATVSVKSKNAKELLDHITRRSEEADALLSGLRLKTTFSVASSVWQEKSRQHRLQYLAGFVAASACAVLIATCLVVFGSHIWTSLPRTKETGEFTYLATLIVALSFVALAWIFRMIGRFITENFYLAEDARQRQTILQTFLNLIGTPETQMRDSERVVILSALFRPAPGQSADDPAPSSLAELIKEGINKK
ncbi:MULTISPECIES: DUF6161 domain-containing protein [unclassified Bradyrhizobium]|uniref:DUF6161 domain-containing protein n=1 Tax=unclassified Bradyrhizobium TaxID=2631580 RepID=UPI0028E21CE2|nr:MULTISPECIES: DUF6161 domain-containing protein [unclassified Bradyrhizobium]